MLKWVFTLILGIFLLGLLTPPLARFIRFGQLPGDFVWQRGGRTYRFPVASTLILSLLLWLLSHLL